MGKPTDSKYLVNYRPNWIVRAQQLEKNPHWIRGEVYCWVREITRLQRKCRNLRQEIRMLRKQNEDLKAQVEDLELELEWHDDQYTEMLDWYRDQQLDWEDKDGVED